MTDLHFDNAFVRDLPADPVTANHRRQVAGALYSRVTPTPVRAPRLVAYASEVAEMLGLDPSAPNFAEVFGGNAVMAGMDPWAAAYGGHQFGNWAGQLGDGRAISLGELMTPHHGRQELQLKGAGPTPYSRGADGRAVMRSSVREFLCSEAMHHLGVPTTRALSLVATGDEVMRDMFYDGNPAPEQGAVVCRVAPSFVRFGSFELPTSRADHGLLKQLVTFTMRRDFDGINDPAEFFAQVCERTAVMIAHWMRVGFVHGVMNTDNMSILGLTIDYGPYGWTDNFDPDWTPNTTDAGQGRYRFGQQPAIAHWNLVRLANALLPLFDDAAPLLAGLERYESKFAEAWCATIAAKLGLLRCEDADVVLMADLERILTIGEIDMTIFFRQLANVTVVDLSLFDGAFYDDKKRATVEPSLRDWLVRWLARVAVDGRATHARQVRMNAVNPKFVLRNYLSQQAIDRIEQGDDAGVHELLDVMRHPYDEQPSQEAYAQRRPDWARNRAGCSALSCSS